MNSPTHTSNGRNWAKTPRVSITVRITSDPDVIGLLRTTEGQAAWGVFVAVLAWAKEHRNGGVFKEPLPRIAETIRVPVESLINAINLIQKVCRENDTEPWLVGNGNGLVIRSYSKWNPAETRGGRRPGAGRKPRHGKSKRNHSEIKLNSKMVDSVSFPLSGEETAAPAAQFGAAPPPLSPPAPDVPDDRRRRMSELVAEAKAQRAGPPPPPQVPPTQHRLKLADTSPTDPNSPITDEAKAKAIERLKALASDRNPTNPIEIQSEQQVSRIDDALAAG